MKSKQKQEKEDKAGEKAQEKKEGHRQIFTLQGVELFISGHLRRIGVQIACIGVRTGIQQ